ncbi:MAG: hypothetical protein R2932_45945 [Caldilineaceae bacterium]
MALVCHALEHARLSDYLVTFGGCARGNSVITNGIPITGIPDAYTYLGQVIPC